jgi:hypothetical protein
MSSTLTAPDGTKPCDEPANETAPTAANQGKPDDDAAAPRFAKALKAKKKQKKLAAKMNQENEVAEDTQQENQESRKLEDAEQEGRDSESSEDIVQEAKEATSPGEQAPSRRKEKIPKNRRKREAQAAAKLDEGKTEAQVQRKPDSGKRETQSTELSAGGKREAREAKKSDDTEQEAPVKRENWQLQKAALKEKFPEGWSPRKRLSPDALAGIRALHQQFPEEYTTEVLANKFEVSPEAVRRILKSKWEPQPEEEIERQERWFSRGKRIWSAWAEDGKKPPTKWRKEGITRDPSYHDQRRARSVAQRKLAKTLM